MTPGEPTPIDARALVGTHDVLWLTLDTLRYDVAQSLWEAGRTPNLARLLPPTGWEPRHTPGSFTYAAHQAFFAGFLPTPVAPGRHPRLFALEFPGSETVDQRTAVFDADNLISGFAGRGYHTVCVGGVGFFNPQTPLGRVLAAPFAEKHWSVEMGVTSRDSTRAQVRCACAALERVPAGRRVLLFVNISALHQPNYFYLPGAAADSPASHAAALEYVDAALPPLFAAVRARGPALVLAMSDHGTAYGEGGYHGHRLAHPVVWTVPYAQCLWTAGGSDAHLD